MNSVVKLKALHCKIDRLYRALSAKHEDLEAVIVDCHEKRKKAMVSHQEKTVTAEKSLLSLEHSLEDLMQRYSSLKDHSSNLEDVSLSISHQSYNLLCRVRLN